MTKPKPDSKERPKPVQSRVHQPRNRRQGRRLGGDKDRVPKSVPGSLGKAHRLVGDSHIEIADKRTYFERNDPFALSLWVRSIEADTSGPLLTRSGGVFDGNRGYGICCGATARFSAALHHVFPDNSIEIETFRGSPRRVASRRHDLRRLQPAAGLRLFLDGQPRGHAHHDG